MSKLPLSLLCLLVWIFQGGSQAAWPVARMYQGAIVSNLRLNLATPLDPNGVPDTSTTPVIAGPIGTGGVPRTGAYVLTPPSLNLINLKAPILVGSAPVGSVYAYDYRTRRVYTREAAVPAAGSVPASPLTTTVYSFNESIILVEVSAINNYNRSKKKEN